MLDFNPMLQSAVCHWQRHGPAQQVLDISGEVTKVVGVVLSTSLQTQHDAALWTSKAAGLKKLSHILSASGKPIPNVFHRDITVAISRDGKVVIGCGSQNGEAFPPIRIGYRVVLPSN